MTMPMTMTMSYDPHFIHPMSYDQLLYPMSYDQLFGSGHAQASRAYQAHFTLEWFLIHTMSYGQLFYPMSYDQLFGSWHAWASRV